MGRSGAEGVGDASCLFPAAVRFVGSDSAAIMAACVLEREVETRGMNSTVLLIAAYLPIFPILFIILRSGSFGRGSAGTFLKLFFYGVAAAVPSFLMEAGGMLAVTILLRIFLSNAAPESFLIISSVLRYGLVAAVIEEAWKHFVLRKATWTKMTMETVADGIAASAAVGVGFSAIMYIAWQLYYRFLPSDMVALREGMPDFLSAGAVVAFIYALLYIPAHFGLSGFMGSLYGIAKGSDQKNHSGRAGFMLALSYMLPMLMHGLFAGMVGYGIASGKMLWYILGFVSEGVLAMIIAITLGSARDAALAAFAAANAANVSNVSEGMDSDNQDGADADAYAESGDDGYDPTEDFYFGTVEGSMETPADGIVDGGGRTGRGEYGRENPDIIDAAAEDVHDYPDTQPGRYGMNKGLRNSGEKRLPGPGNRDDSSYNG